MTSYGQPTLVTASHGRTKTSTGKAAGGTEQPKSVGQFEVGQIGPFGDSLIGFGGEPIRLEGKSKAAVISDAEACGTSRADGTADFNRWPAPADLALSAF
jgi:hypothetical protein